MIKLVDNYLSTNLFYEVAMSKELTVKKEGKDAYNIYIERNFKALGDALINLGTIKDHKLVIVTDTNVEAAQYEKLENSLKKSLGEEQVILKYVFEAGEENKNLDTVKDLYTFLIENHVDRKDTLMAFGGGVVGDLTGFSAASYLRGIDFVQVPTSLLAMCDSSIGGKTGVDFDAYKNMVGAFYMPKLVYMNMAVLKTLPKRQFASGMAEVLKHGIIKDAIYYEWLIDHFLEINDMDLEILEEMIYRSCNIKRMVVENDPYEKGERALLNFGHTIGHAYEKYMNFEMYHGECVAIGMCAAAIISFKRNLLTADECYEIRDMFVPFNLPISIDNVDADEIIRLTKSDKKVEGNTIKFILLKKVGKAYIDKTVTEDEIRAAIEELNFNEED